MDNLIPSCHLTDLFPGIEGGHPLQLDSSLFQFGPEAMPLYLPYEYLVLAAITRHLAPRRIFEFGTAIGRSTLLLALNSPADARVVTVDLPESGITDYSLKCLEGGREPGRLFRGLPCAGKVIELRADSHGLDTGAIVGERGRMELILVDGDHQYDGVRADSLRALEMAEADAVVLWHDYYSFPSYVADPRRRGVYPFLNELAREGRIGLRHITGTYLVAGRASWPSGGAGPILQPSAQSSVFGQRIVRLADTLGISGARS